MARRAALKKALEIEGQQRSAKVVPIGAAQPAAQSVNIPPPNFKEATFHLVGTAPYCMNKMSSDNRRRMIAKQMEGSRSKKGANRAPKDFDAVYKGSMHVSTEGWYGAPASGFRAGMISACKVVGFAMTRAKLSVFVEHDGLDAEDGTPLVKLKGKPVRRDHPVKLADGSSDIIARAFFDNWSVDLHVTWDGDQFSLQDVVNLLSRMGRQVGIGAGRPDSKNSPGMGWGTFRIEQ